MFLDIYNLFYTYVQLKISNYIHVLLKENYQAAGRGGSHLPSQLCRRLKQEDGLSSGELRLLHSSLATEQDPISKTITNMKKNIGK